MRRSGELLLAAGGASGSSQPESCPVRSRNELWIDASPAVVWQFLIRADRWSSFYGNCWWLRFEDGTGPELASGTRFSWWTFGIPVTTTVTDFEPQRVLAWRGAGAGGAAGFHSRLLNERDGGTLVVTEEVQRGLVPGLLRLVLRPLLHSAHQRWLEGLAGAAAQQSPDL